jgi:uncharacterized phage protein (TIGR02218 family)
MIFSNPAFDVTHNKGTAPPVGSPYESVRKPLSLVGRYHADPVLDVIYAPIGPRLLVTVKHIAAFIGQQIEMQGQIFTVTGFQHCSYQQIGVPGSGNPGAIYSPDICYVFVDQDIPQWFKRVQTSDIPKITPANLLLNIAGGRGGQTVVDGEGWLVCEVEPDYQTSIGVRWSLQKLDSFGPYNPFPPNPVQPEPPYYFNASAVFKHHDDPEGHPECASPKDQDSGSPVFVNCGPANDPWVFIGCVSGPGSGAVSPYKGDVKLGTSAAMVYPDNETVRLINGEPPEPPTPLPPDPIIPPNLTTHNGETFYLIDQEQDASAAFEATLQTLATSSAGLTNRETRRPYSNSLRWLCKYQVTLDAGARIAFEAALDFDPSTQFAIPLWPLAIAHADFANLPFTAGAYVILDPPKPPVIFSGSIPTGLGPSAVVIPLCLGTIAKRQTEAIGPDLARAIIDFTESSPPSWAIEPDPFAFTQGPKPSPAYVNAPILCEFPLTFERLAESWTAPAQSSRIGFGRQTQRETYPQAPAREFRADYTVAGFTDIARFCYFASLALNGETFWTPTWKLAALIAGPVLAGQTAFTGPNNLKPGAAIAFVDTETIEPRTVVTADSSGFTIDSPAGPHDEYLFGIHELKLVRLRTREVSLDFLGAGIARGTLDLRDVPAEYTPPAGETLGQTLGTLRRRAYLYTFEARIADTVTTSRFTSFETDLTVAGEGTFTAAKIGHEEIKQSIDLDQNAAGLTLAIFPGNPLVPIAAVHQYGTVAITIRQANVNGTIAEDLEALFYGDITQVSTAGETLTARASAGGEAFDRALPRFTLQPTCNYPLFSVGCTLHRDDWKFTASIANAGAQGFPHTFDLAGLERLNGYPADFFAGGWIELGSGITFEILPILRSTAINAGLSTFTLPRDPRNFPTAGQPVAACPGCDARRETCINKFNNYKNFGGHPFMPKQNASVTRPDAGQSTGKK